MARTRPAAALSGVDRPLLAGLLVATLAASALALHRVGHELPLLESFERRTLDLRFRVRGAVAPGQEVLLVAFDDETLRRAPALFERRAGWARVLGAIAAAHPRAIGVDALFTGDEHVLPEALGAAIDRYLTNAQATETGEAERLLERVVAETRGDAELAGAIAAAGNVVLGVHLGTTRIGEHVPAAAISRAKYGQVLPGPWLPRPVLEVRASIPALNARARALGYVTVYEDESQSLRGVSLARSYEESVFAPLSVQLVAMARGLGRAGLAYLGTEHTIQIGDQRVELGPDDGVLLNLRGPPGTFPVVSAVDVAEGRVPEASLRDRLVVLGITHLGRDTTRTSFGPGMSGLEIHATAIDNLLRADPLVRASFRADALAALLLGLATALCFWPRLGLAVWAQGAGALVALAGYLWLSQYLFSAQRLWLAAVGPALSWAFVAMTSLSLSYAREGIERRRVRHAFAHYLSDGLIDELLADPRALSLGGARRRLTVLFSDIRGFTSISERLDPEALVRLLNAYLTPMTRAVMGAGGLVDKFIGDAVMAFFGAPVPHPDHAPRALSAALRMHEALESLQPTFKSLGVEIEIGVGINTGEMAVGNMGSSERFNYTVMGDAVNLASRLEGLTKTYRVFCIVGEDARAAAGPGYVFRELDLVQVKGKAEPTRVFELTAGPGRQLSSYSDEASFDAGVQHFRAGRFAESRAAFMSFSTANPGDTTARLYLARLDTLGEVPPPGWRGIHVFHEK